MIRCVGDAGTDPWPWLRLGRQPPGPRLRSAPRRPGSRPGPERFTPRRGSAGHPGRSGRPSGGVAPAGRGRSRWCCACRRSCRCGSSGSTRRSRMRPCTCGPAIWSGRTGCTARASRCTRRTSRVPRCSTRRSVPSLTAWAGWWAPGCCPWGSCSWPPPRCGARRPGCTAGGPLSSPPRSGRSSVPRFTWACSRPTTPCPCACSPWPPGARSTPGRGGTRQGGWPPPRRRWSWPTRPSTPQRSSIRSWWRS